MTCEQEMYVSDVASYRVCDVTCMVEWVLNTNCLIFCTSRISVNVIFNSSRKKA